MCGPAVFDGHNFMRFELAGKLNTAHGAVAGKLVMMVMMLVRWIGSKIARRYGFRNNKPLFDCCLIVYVGLPRCSDGMVGCVRVL